MVRYLLILFLLCLFFNIKAQNFVNFDINNYKHTINFIDHKIVFQLKPNKQPKSPNPFKKYYWYSDNRIQITQGGFSGKLLNGSYCDFYLNNNLKEKGTFKLGFKEGEWGLWTVDGILIQKFNYRNGILNGHFMKYDQMGNLLQTGSYRAGKMHGQFKTYYSPDSISVIEYKNGKVKNPPKNWIKLIFTKKQK